MHQKASNSYIAQTRFLFYCHIKIKIPVQYNESVLDECFELLEQIDNTYNSWNENSFFSAINKNSGSWVPVDNTTILLIKELIKISELTNGAYTIALTPLLNLWGFDTDKPLLKIPNKEKIQAAVNLISKNKIQLKESSVKIEKGLALSTGSFLKAFAVDLVIQKLKEKGITAALINAGGSTIAALNNVKHPYWTINIPHPEKKEAYNYQIQLSNNCFSLSGCKTNAKLINNKKYAFIINAQTGYPSKNLQAVVLTKNAFLGDALATGLFSLEEDNLASVTNQLAKAYEFKAYLITENWNDKTINFLNSVSKDFQLIKL